MTMTREEQIIEAAEKATYQKPPQYSELVHKSRKVMCAYETGFIDGCVWADSHPQWIPVEERLPKVSGDYIICEKRGFVREAHYFELDDLWMFHGGALVSPTHWMPLPQPPRKEE